MPRISRLTDYGIVILGHLARTPDRVHSAAQIASLSRIPRPTVSKVLKMLCRAGLVVSERGRHGGCRLATSPDRIAVADAMEALDDAFALTDCCVGATSPCPHQGACPVRGGWCRINRDILGSLRRVSLRDLLTGSSARGLSSPHT